MSTPTSSGSKARSDPPSSWHAASPARLAAAPSVGPGQRLDRLVVLHLLNVVDIRPDRWKEPPELLAGAKFAQVIVGRGPVDAQHESLRFLLALRELITQAVRAVVQRLRRVAVRIDELFAAALVDSVPDVFDGHLTPYPQQPEAPIGAGPPPQREMDP